VAATGTEGSNKLLPRETCHPLNAMPAAPTLASRLENVQFDRLIAVQLVSEWSVVLIRPRVSGVLQDGMGLQDSHALVKTFGTLVAAITGLEVIRIAKPERHARQFHGATLLSSGSSVAGQSKRVRGRAP
jgi:hypothetical protein